MTVQQCLYVPLVHLSHASFLKRHCPCGFYLGCCCGTGWSPARHGTYHNSFRRSILQVLLVQERLLENSRALQGSCSKNGNWHVNDPKTTGNVSHINGSCTVHVGLARPNQGLPSLPTELWFLMCSFLMRDNWPQQGNKD